MMVALNYRQTKMSDIFDILMLASIDNFFIQFEIFLVLGMVNYYVFKFIWLHWVLVVACGI